MTTLEETERTDPGWQRQNPGTEAFGRLDHPAGPDLYRSLYRRALPELDRAIWSVIAGRFPDPDGAAVVQKSIRDIVEADAKLEPGHSRPQNLTNRRFPSRPQDLTNRRFPLTDEERVRIDAEARAEYDRITSAAAAEYERAIAPAAAERERITNEAWAERERMVAEATADYQRIIAPLKTRYERVSNVASVERERIVAEATAKYKHITGRAYVPDYLSPGTWCYGAFLSRQTTTISTDLRLADLGEQHQMEAVEVAPGALANAFNAEQLAYLASVTQPVELGDEAHRPKLVVD